MHSNCSNDFFEPYLIRTIYPISGRFYTGGCSCDNNANGYLLPLKRDVFKSFKIKDLNCSVVPGGDGVKVTLKVPTQNGELNFTKRFMNNLQ